MYGQDRMAREDFMPEPEFRPGLIPFKEPLELKDQHLVSLANNNGYLAGRITELEKANYRLEEQNRKLEREVVELREENQNYKHRETRAEAGYKSGQQLVDEIEKALAEKKKARK